MTSPFSCAKRFIAISLISLIICPTMAFAQRRRTRTRVRKPTSIAVDNPMPAVEPTKTVEVKASVLDQNGRTMSEEEVSWQDLAQTKESPLTFSRSLEDSNTLIITGKKGKEGTEQQFTTIVTATLGELRTPVVVSYKSVLQPKPEAAKITFQPEKVELKPDGEATIKATVRDKEDNAIKKTKVTWSLANPDQEKFISLGAQLNNDTTNSVVIFARAPKDALPQVVTLVATTDQAVGFYNIAYGGNAGEVEVVWGVVPPKIVGDNFGKTIMNDYYCIAVAITNKSTMYCTP